MKEKTSRNINRKYILCFVICCMYFNLIECLVEYPVFRKKCVKNDMFFTRGSQTLLKLDMAKKLPKFDVAELEKLEAQFDSPEDDEEEDDQSLSKPANQDDGDWDSVTFRIPIELDNTRIDNALKKLLTSEIKKNDLVSSSLESISRSQCGQFLSNGCVRISGQGLITKKAHLVQEGDELIIIDQAPAGSNTRDSAESLDSLINGLVNRKRGGLSEGEMIRPQDIPIEILYEDEHMIVVNKHAGIVVHPAAGNWDGTLVNAVSYHLLNKSKFGSGEFVSFDSENGAKDDNGEELGLRPGIVHRLDKGTTGCIVVAKTRQALGVLSQAFADRKVKKTYVTISVGNPGEDVVIDKPIGRHPLYRQKMRVVPDSGEGRHKNRVAPRFTKVKSAAQTGKRALSFVRSLAFDGKLSVAEVRIETGRTHQIRVHLQDRGTPVYGDDIYGISDWNKKLTKQRGIMRPLLHAYKLELNHPITGEKLELCAPMPEDMANLAGIIWPNGRYERPELFSSTLEGE